MNGARELLWRVMAVALLLFGDADGVFEAEG